MSDHDPNFDEALVRSGDMLAREGSLCHQFIVVVDGQLAVHREGKTHVLGPGESYGWRAMDERGFNDATVVARTDARLLVMGHAQFRAASTVGMPAGEAGVVNSFEKRAS